MNVQINETTISEIAAVLDQNADRERTVRIFVSGMQCSGPAFGLALDPIAEGDSEYECGNFKLIMDKELSDAYDEWVVDYVQGGFLVKPANMQSGCGSGCGGGCGSDSGSCGCDC